MTTPAVAPPNPAATKCSITAIAMPTANKIAPVRIRSTCGNHDCMWRSITQDQDADKNRNSCPLRVPQGRLGSIFRVGFGVESGRSQCPLSGSKPTTAYVAIWSFRGTDPIPEVDLRKGSDGW